MTQDRPTAPATSPQGAPGVSTDGAETAAHPSFAGLRALRDRLAHHFDRTFRDRQILIRTEEGVRHWRLSRRQQLMGASALAGLVLWGAVGSAGFLASQLALDSRADRIRTLELEYAQLITDLSGRDNHPPARTFAERTPPHSAASEERIATLVADIARLRAQLRDATEARAALAADKDALGARVSDLETARAGLRDRLEAIVAERDAMATARDAALVQRDQASATASAAAAETERLQAELARVQAQGDEVAHRLADLTNSVEQARQTVASLRSERDGLRDRLVAAETEVDSLQDQLRQTTVAAAQAVSERDRLATAAGERTGTIDRLAAAEAAASRQLADLQAEAAERLARAESLASSRLQRARAEMASANARIADLEADLAAAVQTAANLSAERDRLATTNGELMARTERLTAELDRVQRQNTELASLVQESHLASVRMDGETARLREHNDLLTSRVGSLETELASLQNEQSDLLERLRERADRHVAGIESGLQVTRLDLDDLLERLREEEEALQVAAAANEIAPGAGLGGPMIPGLPEADVLPEDMPPAALDLVALFDRSAELTELASRLPLAVPLIDEYRFTSGFGTRSDPFTGRRSSHFGLDFAAPRRTEIFSPAAGTVIYAGRRGAYGNLVEIDHGLGVTTLYAHLHEISVDVGDTVSPGDPIGLLGSTGRSTGPHLHYEIRIDDRPMNPMNFVRAGQHVLEVSDTQQ